MIPTMDATTWNNSHTISSLSQERHIVTHEYQSNSFFFISFPATIVLIENVFRSIVGIQAEWDKSHGHLLRTAYKLSNTKIEHSHWSTGHSTHL